MIRIVIAFALCALVVAQAPTDHCSPFLTCPKCVAQPLCGWCSEDVVYPGNITGPQCAGFNANGSAPFACNGIYSTEQCVAGYVCNETDFTCVLGQEGQGNTKSACEANCTNEGQVYLCNKTVKKCYEVPRGTPGSSSYAVCEAACTIPSSHPSSSSPHPPPTPAPLYACNFTSGQCVKAPAGKGEALSVCEQQCSKSNVSYLCNKFLQKCIQLPPGVHGDTLAECEAECIVKPTPGPQAAWSVCGVVFELTTTTSSESTTCPSTRPRWFSSDVLEAAPSPLWSASPSTFRTAPTHWRCGSTLQAGPAPAKLSRPSVTNQARTGQRPAS